MNINKLYKEFKKDHPETIGETDKTFDQDNYKDWLEIQVMKLRDTQQVNGVNTSKEECTLHNVSKAKQTVCPYCKQPLSVNNTCVNVLCGNWLNKCK